MSTFNVGVSVPQLAESEPITNARINQLFNNIVVTVIGTVGTASIPDNSITTSKLVDGVLSANTLGQGKMATGYILLSQLGAGIFTANASGWAPFANGWLPLSLVGSGIFTAVPAGRAPFAAGLINASLMQPDAYSYATGGGSGSAYTASFTPGLNTYSIGSGGYAFTYYWDGLRVMFEAAATSSAAATLNVDTLGIKGIYRKDGTAIQAGDILSGQTVEVVYSTSLNSGGGGWQLLTAPQPPAVQAGTATMLVSTSTIAVTLAAAMPTTNYVVTVTPVSPVEYLYCPFVTINSTTQFTITYPITLAGSGVTFQWIAMMRTQ